MEGINLSPDAKKKRDESPTARRRRLFFTVLETLTVLFAMGAIGLYGDLLGTLGAISFQMGRHGLAEGLFRDSLRLQEKVHGPRGLELCWPLNQMAYFYYMTEQFDKAVPVAERSLAICRTNLGPKAPRCAWTFDSEPCLRRRW